MSIVTRIKRLFSSPSSCEPIGISLNEHSIAYFSRCQQTVKTQRLAMQGNSYSQSLPELLEENQLSGQCHIVLANGQSQIVQVDKPRVPAEELNDALKWQVKDLVTIDPEDMVLDYFDGPMLAGGVEKLNVVCGQKSVLRDLVSAVNADNTQVATITTEEFAFASLLPIHNEAILMVCQQPNEEINLLIVKHGQIFFSRRLRGFRQLQEKSEQELSMGLIDTLSLEIQRSTDYFERQLKQAPIRAIDVLVPMENEAFLARKLAENTNVEVRLCAMPEGLEQHRDSAVAIGATQLHFMEESANG